MDTTVEVPSPFRDGMQWAWDSTSLGWLKECPRKYYYHMIQGWRPKGEQVHLEFGIHYHGALEAYTRQRAIGSSHQEALRIVIKETLVLTNGWRNAADIQPDDRAPLKTRENLIRTIVWYLEKFKDDPARVRVHPSTGVPMVELHFQFSIEGGYDLCGYLDTVVDFQDQPFVMDRKTTTMTLGSYYFDKYDPDNQMSLYTVASQIAFHTPVKGVIIDAAQVAVGFSRFVRSIVYRTPDQIDEWLWDLTIWLGNAKRYAEMGYWPQNDKSCHNFGGCVFRGICSKSPQVRHRYLESDFVREPWNPLQPR